MSLVARGSRTARRRSPGRRATGAEGAGRPVSPAPRSAPNSGPRTALQKHVDFFDTDRTARSRSPTRTTDFADSVWAPPAPPRSPA